MTGDGCYIDASQVEAGLYLAGTAHLDYAVNGRRWSRYGNRSPYKPAAPHGIYTTNGDDRWIAISCFTEDEWRALAGVLGHSEWVEDPRFHSLSDRIEHQDDLDRLVAAATISRTDYELMAALQAADVAAGVCQTARDKCEIDPQLAHLGWLVDLPQTDLGSWPAKEAPFTMTETPPAVGGRLRRHGPNYGEDSDYVLTEVLGLAPDDVQRLKDAGVIADASAALRA
jgi:crotonobetainyl-CoA:carnitine CoA-transferase CaiB-like acyl-CoA transferase